MPGRGSRARCGRPEPAARREKLKNEEQNAAGLCRTVYDPAAFLTKNRMLTVQQTYGRMHKSNVKFL